MLMKLCPNFFIVGKVYTPKNHPKNCVISRSNNTQYIVNFPFIISISNAQNTHTHSYSLFPPPNPTKALYNFEKEGGVIIYAIELVKKFI